MLPSEKSKKFVEEGGQMGGGDEDREEHGLFGGRMRGGMSSTVRYVQNGREGGQGGMNSLPSSTDTLGVSKMIPAGEDVNKGRGPSI
jgi:hypothetical protein